MTDCADMDCNDCCQSQYATTPKRDCPFYIIKPEDTRRRKLLKASSSG